jgi:hypothetical protein
MLFLNPTHVTLAATELDNVSSIMLSRRATKTIVDYDDAGPHPVFADVPEQRAEIVIRRTLTRDEGAPAALGDQEDLSFTTAPNTSSAQRRAISMSLVVTAIEHTIARSGGCEQTIRAVAVAPSPTTDPVIETTLED